MKKEYLIYKLSDEVKNSCKIDREAFTKYGVKRGLRNEDVNSCSWIIILKILSIFCTSGRKMPLTNCVRMASFKMLLEI